MSDPAHGAAPWSFRRIQANGSFRNVNLAPRIQLLSGGERAVVLREWSRAARRDRMAKMRELL